MQNAYTFPSSFSSRSGAYVYVSAGVNYWGPPVKIYDKTEVTLLTLIPHDEALMT